MKTADSTLLKQVLGTLLAMLVWDFLLNNVFFDWQSIHAGHSRWAVPWALLSFVPNAFLAWLYVRYLSRMDELQRRMQLEACATALVGGASITAFYGYLETGGAPHLDLILVSGLLVGLWLLGYGMAHWRYR
jgi:hypothetical protein